MGQKPRIAIIGKKNYLYWDSHVADAFKELGHEVIHFQINNRSWDTQLLRGITKGLLGKKIGNSLTDKLHANDIKKRLITFKPDLIFFNSAFFIPEIFYEVAKELPNKPIIAAWDGDGGAYNILNKKYSQLIDILFETERIYCEQNLLEVQKIFHLPFCINPRIHKNKYQQRSDSIYFCGAWSPVRDASICAIKDFPIDLKGWNWKNLSCTSSSIKIQNGTVDMQYQVKDYNSALMVLNKHQEVNHIQALNMRTFEVPGCGALLINDYRDELPMFYDIGNEILAYKDDNELKNIVSWVFDNKNQAQKIAEEGYQRTIREHTYQHRMEVVLRECGF